MKLFRLPRWLLALALAAILLPAPAGAQTMLRYTDHEPLGGMRTRFIKDVFFTALEKESAGRLKVGDRWDSALATGYEALRRIGEGAVADIGIVVPEYSEKELPLHQIFKSFPAGPAGGRQVAFFRRVYADVPAFTEELRKNNLVPIFLATGYPVAFFGTKPLDALPEIKGQTWRTASFWHRDFLRNAGANPITIPWGQQVFDALKDRRLDGLMVNIDSGYMLKVHEVAPAVLASRDLWLGHLYILAMNAGVWNALAQEDRAAIARAAETAYAALGKVMDDSFEAMVADMRKEGVKVRLLETAEVRAFAAATRYEDIQTAWAQTVDARGAQNAGTVMERVRTLLRESLQ